MKFIFHNRRPLLYGLSMALGLVLIQQLLLIGDAAIAPWAIAALWLILLLELFSDYYFSKKLLRQLGLPSVERYSQVTQIIYHSVLPSGLYFALVSLIYATNVSYLSWLYFLTAMITFSLLFINIRAYYEDKYKLEESTHVVYDLIKLIMFFSLTNFTLQLASSLEFNFFIQVGIIFCLGSLLTLLVLLRARLKSNVFILLVLLCGLSLGYLTATLHTYLNASTMVIAFVSSIVFYIFNAILHHEQQRTLTIQLVVEYILVAALSLLILLLLN